MRPLQADILGAVLLLVVGLRSNSPVFAAQCSLILGHDLYGNDLLGPDKKPAPQNVSGPAECCDLCSTKPEHTIPQGKCKAWSYNHGTSTCWMKTGHGSKIGCVPNELCPNGDTSGVVLSATPADPAADLQQKINQAVGSGVAQLSIAAGDYFFGNRTLLIQGARNFALRAAGPVNIWFSNADGGFLIRDSHNVTIDGMNTTGTGGLHIDRSPPPFVQGTVTKVAGKTLEFTLDGDSDDPRSSSMTKLDRDPSKPPAGGMDGTHCYAWKKGAGAGGGSTVGSGRYCADSPSGLTAVGPGRFSAAAPSGTEVGDQFVSIVWRGFTYTIANSSDVTTQDVSVHAGGYMAVAEMDGAGRHVYRNLQVVPRNGRLIASNADGFHSADVDHAPTFDNVHFRSMLDDYMNFQTTLLMVLDVQKTALTIVHPHTSDQPDDFGDNGEHIVDLWYGTTEPLSRVQAGDELIFYDPVTFTEMGRVLTKAAAVLLSPATDQNSTLARRADALFELTVNGQNCNKTSPQPCVPYDFPSFSKQHYRQQRLRSTVYSLDLEQPPPKQSRPGAMAALPYIVQIARTSTVGAVVKNSLFEDSSAFYGRWKSSHSILHNCTFRGNGNPELEMQMLPSFYEGPVHIENISITNCTFDCTGDPKTTTIDSILDLGPECCKVQGLVQSGNVVVH